jgi:hypothetical protein
MKRTLLLLLAAAHAEHLNEQLRLGLQRDEENSRIPN